MHISIHLSICMYIFLYLGVQEDKLFEADPNLQYTYAWDRLNVYRQRVYGVTTANIKVNKETNKKKILKRDTNKKYKIYGKKCHKNNRTKCITNKQQNQFYKV